jgi:amylosucrase
MVATKQEERRAKISLERLRPRLNDRFGAYARRCPEDWQTFINRLESNFDQLFQLLVQLYGNQYDFFYHFEELLVRMARSWVDRSPELKALDAEREAQPLWFQSNQMLGGVCYVDLFAGDLEGVRSRIPYFKELGLTYLHLMPLFRAPEGENDGGYAVSSYREVSPCLGTMEQLGLLASELRHEGISLVVDLVFNHTSDENEWARRAASGDLDYQEFYWIFPDRQMPARYEAHLREIFPDEHPGAFTYRKEIDRWVWTTFHSYQWDLNYANPEVFNHMAGEMLFLANIGVEVLRLDAVAFIWKQLGTNCENLPEAHQLIQAFNAVARIAAPALLFKSEAIVHPDEVVRYISSKECQLSYNPLLMSLLWNSLATREVRLLHQALHERFKISSQCAWVNYVRCHDDIGWTFSDEDAAQLGVNGHDHRRFLNAFYTNRFEGSFARGLPFQENPKTGDARISGACASLAGLEKAVQEENSDEIELAIRRILLIHSVILTVGGIPLIYLGDEIGILNDYSYRNDPTKAGDSRWVHRPSIDWKKVIKYKDPDTLEGQIYHRLSQLIQIRKQNPAFSGSNMQVMDLGNPHVLGYVRHNSGQRVIILANFTEQEQSIPSNQLRLYGLTYKFTDLIKGEEIPFRDLKMEPFQTCFLQC